MKKFYTRTGVEVTLVQGEGQKKTQLPRTLEELDAYAVKMSLWTKIVKFLKLGA